MDDVARHLCISKKTLYEHFKDKEDLVEKVMELEYEERNNRFQDIERKNLNAIEELFEVYQMLNSFYRNFNPSMEYDIRKYYPDLYIKIKDIRRKRMYDSTLNNMNRGKTEGLYRPEIDTAILSKLHLFRVENLSDNDLFSIDELISFKFFHEIFVYHIHGLLSEKGRKFFEANFRKYQDTLA